MPWIVGVTKPNCEALAEANLKRQDYGFYCPRIAVREPNQKLKIRPLFPRYIFILIQQCWYPLRSTYGLSSLLMGDGGGPQPVPAQIIEALVARQDKKGYVQLTPKPKFVVGDRVRATAGVWAGRPMIYQGMLGRERVRVLMEMLGCKCPVELEEKVLVAA